MAQRRKKQKKRRFAIQLELGLGGVLAIGVVSFCVFLWMFLLGIWAGQTVLRHSSVASPRSVSNPVAKSAPSFGQDVVLADAAKRPKVVEDETVDSEAEPEYNGPTFFSLQVGSFDSEAQAMQAVAAWRARDQESFYVAPEGREKRFRVFVGKYDTLERANDQASLFEQQEKTRVYVTLLQESEIKEP